VPERRVDAFVVCVPGLEAMLLAEVQRLGVRPARAVKGGVECTVTWPQMWALNLWSRLATRVIVRVTRFPADGFDSLRRGLDRVDWARWLPVGGVVLVEASCDQGSKLFHTDAVAERVHAALVARRALGAATNAVGGAATVMVRVQHDVVTISLDSSGAPLHHRGWRGPAGKAPLRPTLAAALVQSSGWDMRAALVDPLCGSGTIAIEAAHIARKIAPGRQRSFAFESWPTFDADGWRRQIDAADSNVLARCPTIVAGDRDAGAATAARANALAAGVDSDVEVQHAPLKALRVPDRVGWIVTNPPYGQRLPGAPTSDLRNLYDSLAACRRNWSGASTEPCHIALVAPRDARTAALVDRLGPTSADTLTTNGGLPVALYCSFNAAATA
jgi:putative N6-adenine-specific DNA methylase